MNIESIFASLQINSIFQITSLSTNQIKVFPSLSVLDKGMNLRRVVLPIDLRD